MKPVHRSSHYAFPAALAAALAFALAGGVQAQDGDAQVGKLIFANGDVEIVDGNGQSRRAKQGDLIAPGERVVTGDGALAQVKMNDGGRVGVRADSSVAFEPRALAVAGAPTVLSLQSGDVRVLNIKENESSDPREYVLKTTDGMIQLKNADTIASLRAPTTGGGPDTPKETFVRLSAGNAVVSNKRGNVQDVSKNQLVAFTPNELKTGASDVVPAPPRISSRVSTPTDRLSQQIARTTPIESSSGSRGLALWGPLPGAYDAPAGFSTKGYRLDPKVITAKPTTLRVESKLTPNPIPNTPLKPSVPAAQFAAVRGNQVPSVVVPPSKLSSFTVNAPTTITRTLTPVVSGTISKTAPTTIKLPTTFTTLKP